MSSYREDLIREMTGAQKTLQKYEERLLKGEVDTEDKEFFKDRINFWSSSVVELRKALIASQSSVEYAHKPPLVSREL